MKLIYVNFCLILLIPFIANQKQILNDLRDMKMTEFINVAMYMTKRFISPRTNTLIIMERCDYVCEEHKKYHSTLLQEFLNNLHDALTIQLFFAQPEYRPWDYNLFIVDSWASFESLRIIIPTTEHERDFYFFILLTWGSDFMLMRNLQQIFQLCQLFRVSNVVVMAKATMKNFIGFYTYEMFSAETCFEEVTVQEINRYENGRLKHDFLFPKQLTNYYGCTLNVSARVYAPLLTFHGDVENETHLTDMQHLGGIEGEILKLVAKELNFTIRLRFAQEKSVINLYINSTGCFGDLEQKAVQLVIGGFDATIRNNDKFTKTSAHHTTFYKFVVRSNVYFSVLKQLMSPLHNSTWLFLAATVITAITLIQLINVSRSWKMYNFIFGIKNKDPTFNLLLTFLGFPMPDRVLPKRNFARYILVLWLLFSLIMRTSYQGKLFDSLRLARWKPIPKTISELINADYTLLSSAYTNFYPYNQTKICKNCSDLLQQLQSSEMPWTVTVISDNLADYNLKNRNSNALTSVDESIFSYQCVIYLQKNSIFRESFERKIKVFINSGITAYIAKKHVHSHYKDLNAQSQHVSRITLRSLRAVFYVFGMLCFISIAVLILELLTKKSKLLENIINRLS